MSATDNLPEGLSRDKITARPDIVETNSDVESLTLDTEYFDYHTPNGIYTPQDNFYACLSNPDAGYKRTGYVNFESLEGITAALNTTANMDVAKALENDIVIAHLMPARMDPSRVGRTPEGY